MYKNTTQYLFNRKDELNWIFSFSFLAAATFPLYQVVQILKRVLCWIQFNVVRVDAPALEQINFFDAALKLREIDFNVVERVADKIDILDCCIALEQISIKLSYFVVLSIERSQARKR